MFIKPFQETLSSQLKDDAVAAAYIKDAMTDTPEDFLRALHDVVVARGCIISKESAITLSFDLLDQAIKEKI